jgi:hypothetical protein
VHIVHRELNLPNFLDNRFNLERLPRGIRRVKGSGGRRKFAVTPAMLSEFFLLFEFSKTVELAIYAAMLVAFIGFFRKGNATIDPQQAAENVTFFRRFDFFLAPDDSVVWVLVCQTKTIQFFEREIAHPPDGYSWVRFVPGCRPPSPFLGCSRTRFGPRVQLSGDPDLPQSFNPFHLCRPVQSLGRPHWVRCFALLWTQLRRGGATFAILMGVPGELIQLQGNWLSNAYLLYLKLFLLLKKPWLH